MRKVIQVVVHLRRQPSPEHIPVAASKTSPQYASKAGGGKGEGIQEDARKDGNDGLVLRSEFPEPERVQEFQIAR